MQAYGSYPVSPAASAAPAEVEASLDPKARRVGGKTSFDFLTASDKSEMSASSQAVRRDLKLRICPQIEPPRLSIG